MLLKNIQAQVKGHSVNSSLQLVHTALNQKYNWNRQAQRDKVRAQKMEDYLRLFKGLAKKDNASFKQGYSGNMDTQAMISIAEQVRNQISALSPNAGQANRLFYNIHSRYVGNTAISGVDDVFEAELRSLLNFALQEAVLDVNKISLSSYAKVLGQQLGNIPSYAINKLMKQFPQLINNTSKEGKFITKPQYKSAKVDVKGYGSQVLLEAQIKPEWQDFIKTFTGARFTVKNYRSNSTSKYSTTIHLGNTDVRKAIIATLIDLQVQKDDAVHVYYHSLNEKEEKNFEQHIFHLRFAYELTGAGLVDENGDKLDAADFFIYNDPITDNIFVRSTKDMIANMMNYTPSFKGDPYKTHIVIVKSAF